MAPPNARAQFASLIDTTARDAGNSTGSNVFNGDTGVATATTLNVPSYVVFDSLGNLYISDTQNNCVREVSPSGNITTVAGLRGTGSAPDTCNTSTNSSPTPVQGLLQPTGLAIDSNNTLYIADSQHNCVRSLASGLVDSEAHQNLTTVAGTCSSVHTGSNTPLPDGLAVDSSSNLYISIVDSLYPNAINQVVRHLSTDPATTICVVAGQLSTYPTAPTTQCAGITSTVTLNRPAGLAFDKNGNLFIADSTNNCVREIAGLTTPQTVVGQCSNDLTGSTATALNNPYGLAFSSSGSLYISESGTNHNNVASYNFGSNSLTLVAGLPTGASGPYNSSQDGQSATTVPLNQPLGVTTDTGGNIYLADSQNNVVRKMGFNIYFPNTNVGSTSASQTVVFSINQTVNLTTTVGTDFNIVSTTCNGVLTSANTCTVTITFSPSRPGYRYSALVLRDSISGKLISVQLGGIGIGPLSLLVPGVASTRASSLRTAIAVSTDSAGDTYVLEQGNGSSTADVLFFPAGGGAPQVAVAQGAGMVTPTAMAVDGAGNIFIADAGIAGGSIIRFGADGSVNTSYATGVASVTYMAVDGFDDLFLTQAGSVHSLTEIYAGGQRSTIAGNGTVVDANGVAANTALFNDPTAVALGPNGIAVADAGTHYVYLISNSGIINIVAGNGTVTTTSAGVATGTGLVLPDGLAIDAAGDIYIADSTANIVYAVYAIISNGTNINPVIGTGTAGDTGDNGPSNAATIHAPLAIALDGSSDLFVIDSGNNALREVSYPVTSTIDFGNVLINTTSPAMLQYLANAGNASLDFHLPFTTTATPPYAVLAGSTTCTANSGVMSAGGVCDIAYTFHPTVAGPVAGQSNLPTNSYNTPQIVFFNGESGFSTTTLPFTLTSETEVYGYPFTESLTLNNTLPASGSMVFSIGAQTLCTTSITNASAGTVTCNAPESGLAVGTYTVNFTFTSTNLFYSSTTGTTTLVITKAPLTVTPNNFSRQYGVVNPTLTGTVTGAVNGDVFNVTYSTTATQFSPVGNYPITATLTPQGLASLNNYSVTYNVGTLTVTQAGSGGVGNGLTVTVNSFSRQYGVVNPTFTGTVSGLLNGDTVTVTYSSTATQFSPVGTYPITATVSGAAAANYVVTVIPGTLTVTPSGSGGSGGLTVTVNNASRPYGTPNPTFTGTVTGLLNGDTVTVTYSTTATITSPIGTYPITATVSGAAAGNYTIHVIPGTLTITTAAAPLVITVNNASRPYGAANPTFTSTIAGALNGDTFTINYSTPATIASPVGNYAINATVSGAAAGNYNVIVVPGTLTITPTAPLVVTVNNFSRPYGQPNPTFTSTIAGAINGDTFTVSYSTSATQFSPVGTYPINATVSGANIASYSVTVVPGTLIITPAGTGGTTGLLVTVNNFSRPYGTPNPTFTSTVTGLLNGDTVTINYSTAATIASPVGTYAINATVSGPAAANYIVTVVPGTLTITTASFPMVVTVFNATRPYGTANPAFTSSISGLLNGDTVTVTYSTTATIASPVGAYPINATISGAAAANYTIVVDPGTLIITTAINPLVVTVNNATRPYGTANPTFSGSISGLLNGDGVIVAFSTTATPLSPVGTYPINAIVTGPAAANYTVTVVPGTLTITPASVPLVVTVNNAARPYGTPNPTFTSSISGALNGDTFTINYSTPATLTSPVGTYPINATVSGPVAANYNVTVVPGILTIGTAGAPLVVTVNSATRPYNTPNPTFTGTVSGLLNGDTVNVTYTTPATITSPVGTYPINATVSGAAAANYTVIVNPGTLTITPVNAPLVVTVNNASRPYGAPNPTFTSTIAGALNGDTFTVTYSTPATAASPIGIYPINATVTGANIANYIVTVVPGTLSITSAAAPLVVTVNNAGRPYGTPNPTFTSTITGALNGDTFTVTYSTTATVASDVGTYPINATAVTGANIGNYSVTVVPGTLSIAPLATVTTVATSASPVYQGTGVTFTATVTYGASLPVPATTVTFYNGTTLLGTGTLNAAGVATYTTSTLPVGSSTITATYQATLDFASSSGSVLQVVNPGTFTVSAIPPNQFIRGAGSTSYAITVNALQGFSGPVTLTCSGLPADASCTFANPTVTLAVGGSATTTLIVVNTEADARLVRPIAPGSNPSSLSPIAFAAAFPFGLGAFLIGIARRRRGRQPGRATAFRSPRIRLLLVLLCASGILSLAGCACLTSIYQIYTIPITATSTVTGASTQTASVTLTVAQQ
ncbi:MAG TPA: MBG domain-containing protein [Acidobacteriaceae bacterium]|nr:MBG domain-containing protein [Acidobacteriaceae bacterium]